MLRYIGIAVLRFTDSSIPSALNLELLTSGSGSSFSAPSLTHTCLKRFESGTISYGNLNHAHIISCAEVMFDF